MYHIRGTFIVFCQTSPLYSQWGFFYNTILLPINTLLKNGEPAAVLPLSL